jgi:hypothetical protein
VSCKPQGLAGSLELVDGVALGLVQGAAVRLLWRDGGSCGVDLAMAGAGSPADSVLAQLQRLLEAAGDSAAQRHT